MAVITVAASGQVNWLDMNHKIVLAIIGRKSILLNHNYM